MAKSITTIQVNQSYLSALSLDWEKKTGWTVRGAAMEGIAPPAAPSEDDDEDEAIAHDELPIKEILKSFKTQTPTVSAVMPRQWALVRRAHLPTIDSDELAQMVQFEAQRHIPFHAERHLVGYHLVEKKGVEGSEVLICALDRFYAEGVMQGVRSSAAQLDGMTLSSVALANAVLATERETMGERVTAVVNIGLDAIDLITLHNGHLLYSRSIPLRLRPLLEAWIGFDHQEAGSPAPSGEQLARACKMIDWTKLAANPSEPGAPPDAHTAEKAKDWFQTLLREWWMTADYVRREAGSPPIEQILLTGEGAAMVGLTATLESALEQPCTLFNPVGKCTLGKDVSLPFDGLAMTIPFGAAVARYQEGSYRIDLTPVNYYKQVARGRLLRQLAITAVLLVLTIGSAGGGWARYDQIRKEAYFDYVDFNDNYRDHYMELREKQRRLRILRQYLDDPNGVLKVMQSVITSRTIPNRVSLLSFDYTRDSKLTLEATARTVNDMNAFVDDLNSSGHFEYIRQSDPSEMKLHRRFSVYRFSLECLIKPSSTAARSN